MSLYWLLKHIEQTIKRVSHTKGESEFHRDCPWPPTDDIEDNTQNNTWPCNKGPFSNASEQGAIIKHKLKNPALISLECICKVWSTSMRQDWLSKS